MEIGFPDLYDDDDDTTRGRKVRIIVTDPFWLAKWFVVSFITTALCYMQSWGIGCDCHVAEIKERGSVNVECMWKGRRMLKAYQFGMQGLRRMLAESNLWTLSSMRGNQVLLDSCQGCVRGIYYMGCRQLSYLNCVPYLLARLHEPGVRGLAVRQYLSCPRRHHHRETVRILAEDCIYAEDVAAIAPDGSGVSARLEREREGIARMPFNDATMEAPHNLANRVHEDAPSAAWEWIAATCRLCQNLVDVRFLAPFLGCDLAVEWRDRKKVLQPPGRPNRVAALVRLKDKAFYERVYNLKEFDVPAVSGTAGGDDGDNGGGGGDDDADEDDDDGGSESLGDEGGMMAATVMGELVVERLCH